ncbi:AlpA family phage regulatory protein [Legionella longbeachae]|uniref:helix-turn-helix transcriptional regulator n=1 Tax=Legionella longbeachae TaxID=450 RepID=UPI0009B7C54A|nr:AlpA family phage regulatory protein [Legionella longbeachae]ARB92854.1 AlpA family phage regulatory protein [Legionella longbeachae]RZV26504.1 AlpA family phage regulatory protein [Legionella longbeachae]UAK47257.1 AlpA family phage regulatory protein [Legionella longbeachae]VEE04323.1 Predicted transcriptional regulator [Legionella oakridgensis]
MTQIKSKGVIRWRGLRKRFDDNISRSTIDRWIKAGKFPPKIRLGKNSVGWSLEAVDQWFQDRAIAAQEIR